MIKFDPIIYPQGSFRIGTTTKPIKHEEYDLDFVCQLQIDWNVVLPKQLQGMIYERICENETYRRIAEPKKRCIRLNYAGEFHLDILPACPDFQTCNTCIKVPDRKMNGGNGGWSASNPKGYAAWFENIALQYKKLIEAKRIEPLPKPEQPEQKPPLKQAVQLFKRWRDISFEKDDELAPVSIVLTTMAAERYRSEATVVETFTTIINGIADLIKMCTEPFEVWNPTNRKELLSEKWREKPEAYTLFKDKMIALQVQWHDLLSNSRGLEALSKYLKILFGESVVDQAFKNFDKQGIAEARKSGKLGIQPASGILSTFGLAKVVVPGNTFHGKIF